MSYLDKSADAVREAFEVDGVHEALHAFVMAFWVPTETYAELVDLVLETAAHLDASRHARGAAFCTSLHGALVADTAIGEKTCHAFLVQCLRITGWATPSPARAATAYIERQNAYRKAVTSACRSYLGDVRQRADRQRKEIAREARRDEVVGAVKKSALAVGTLGMSLLLAGM